MSANLPEFNRGVVKPMECLRGGWDLIKDQYWLFMGMAFVAILIGSAVPMGILMGPMMCGLYMALFLRQRGQPITFDLLFKGFDFFGDSLIATLIHMVPMLAIMLPSYFIMIGVAFTTIGHEKRGEPPNIFPLFAAFGLFFLVIMITGLVIGAFFAFTYPLIVDRRLSGINAVKTSIKAAMGNLGGVFGLMFLNMVLGVVGVMLCYVGAFLFMPISFAAWSVAYRQVFGTTDMPVNTPPAPPVF
jgi:uncharacterized membrane protein